MALARLLAQALVQRIGVTAQQVGGGRYAQPPKVSGDGWADVGDVFQGGDILSGPGLASNSSSGYGRHGFPLWFSAKTWKRHRTASSS